MYILSNYSASYIDFWTVQRHFLEGNQKYKTILSFIRPYVVPISFFFLSLTAIVWKENITTEGK